MAPTGRDQWWPGCATTQVYTRPLIRLVILLSSQAKASASLATGLPRRERGRGGAAVDQGHLGDGRVVLELDAGVDHVGGELAVGRSSWAGLRSTARVDR